MCVSLCVSVCVSLCVSLCVSVCEQKEIRSSLVLSMLQQMLAEDKADMVREAVVKSLGIIMGYIDDPDKYSQVCVCVCDGVPASERERHCRL